MVEPLSAVDDAACHQVDDAFLAALDFPLDPHQPRRHHRTPLLLHVARPEQCVDHAGLVLDRDEHGIALARPLADEDDARARHPPTIGRGIGIGAAQHAFAGETFPQELHRMRFQRQPQHLVIGDHLLRQRHYGQLRIGFRPQFRRIGKGKERQLVGWGPPRLPQRIAPPLAQ